MAEKSPSPPEIAELETDKRQYAPSEAIRVTLTNSSDTAISCPVAADACALARFERVQHGRWSRWSSCERLRKVERPFLIEPGGVLKGSLRRDPALRRSGVETYEGPLPKPDDSGRKAPPSFGRVVEQLTDESPPPPPFFEHLDSLPDGRYRLATTCAPADWPDRHQEIRSPSFEAGDEAGD